MLHKKKMSIFLYFILMTFLFFFVFLFQQVFIQKFGSGLFRFKFGVEAILEILWAGLVLILVLLFKNRYIFTQKRESFLSGIHYILPELILSVIFFFFGLFNLFTESSSVDLFTLFNLILYCVFIGIVEEFLCRGWLLNEFLERYSSTKKEIILSIFFSSLIFGIIHFFNLGETQGFFETLVQVMNATASGIFLALVYYKTKNIWLVVFSHAVWDFSLMFIDINSLGDCLVGNASFSMILSNVIRGVVITFAYLCLCYWLYCKTDLYQGKNTNKKGFVIFGIIVYLFGLFFISYTEENYYTCPNYQIKKISKPSKVSFYRYDEYSLKDHSLSLKVDSDTGRLVLENAIHDSIYLTEDSNFSNYLLLENDDCFLIAIQKDYNVISYHSFLKKDIQNTKKYLKKVKKNLDLYVLSEINQIGSLEFESSSYQYIYLQDRFQNDYYFDKNGKLYLFSS